MYKVHSICALKIVIRYTKHKLALHIWPARCARSKPIGFGSSQDEIHTGLRLEASVFHYYANLIA